MVIQWRCDVSFISVVFNVFIIVVGIFNIIYFKILKWYCFVRMLNGLGFFEMFLIIIVKKVFDVVVNNFVKEYQIRFVWIGFNLGLCDYFGIGYK